MKNLAYPVWMGYLLLSPIRKLRQNPYQILLHYVRQGMYVLDVGSAMGYFSLPIAEIVGTDGKVICVDIQPKMLERLSKRSKKFGLEERIITNLAESHSLKLENYNGKIDFALAFALIHETPDPNKILSEIFNAVKSGGGLLVAEPKSRVSEETFTRTISLAEKNHFIFISRPTINNSHSAYFTKM